MDDVGNGEAQELKSIVSEVLFSKFVRANKTLNINTYVNPLNGELVLEVVDMYYNRHYARSNEVVVYIGEGRKRLTLEEVLKGAKVIDYVTDIQMKNPAKLGIKTWCD